jgi:hypothetical protein
MAGKNKLVMCAGQPEEIKKESLSFIEHWIKLKNYKNFGG